VDVYIGYICGFLRGSTALLGQCLLIVKVSRSHSDIPHSVRLLCTSDRPVAETSTCTTHNSHNRQSSMLLAGFKTRNSSNLAVADPLLRPRGHWDRQLWHSNLKLYTQLSPRHYLLLMVGNTNIMAVNTCLLNTRERTKLNLEAFR
jgi:hypothetical protein